VGVEHEPPSDGKHELRRPAAFAPDECVLTEAARQLGRLGELERALAGRARLEAEGRDPKGGWPAEPGFLVPGIPRGEATELARRFGQNAFVWCERGRAAELVLAATWRLVLDTHVWLDWVAFEDPSVGPLKAAVAEERAEVYLDAACAAELERVLGYPMAKRVADKEVQAARLAAAWRIAKRPERELGDAERASLPRCADAEDQKFLELALAARADVLLTRDRELLRLARRTPFRILPPAAFTVA
jgi:putative PIN family toxin of toxin-antitoxin system